MPDNSVLEEIDRLGELLAQIPDSFVPMELDMLDGFLTALSLLRSPPEPQSWLPLVFDMEGRTRAQLSDPQKQAELRRLIMSRGAYIEKCILQEKPIDPVIYEDDIEEGVSELSALAPFSDGFAFACSNWPELLKNSDKAVQAALVGILRYESTDDEESASDIESEDILQSIEDEVPFVTLDEAIADLAACVQEIAEVTRSKDIESASRSSSKSKHSRKH